MKKRPGVFILIIAALALAAKLYCASTTVGTTDTMLLAGCGRYIAQSGLINLYLHAELFNFPPLAGNYMALIYTCSHGDGQRFALLNRLPGIVADLAVVLLMLWIRSRPDGRSEPDGRSGPDGRMVGRLPWWALALLAASPVCFMISGYHGNYDSLIPLGLMLAVVASMEDRVMLAGVALGLVCQVKIVPLVMSPVLFFYWLNRGKGAQFALSTGAILLAGWSAPLMAIPATFFRQVLAYNSIWGWWGIPYLLNKSGLPGMSGIRFIAGHTMAQDIVMHGLKLLIVASALFIAWRRRRESAVSMLGTMGLIWAVFFTFAPGFGVQYLAWVSPFLLYFSARWFAAFTAAASLGLFMFYNTISGGMPWLQGYRLEERFGTWAPWLLVPWVAFVAMVVASRREIFRPAEGGGMATNAAGSLIEKPGETTVDAGTPSAV